MSFSPWEGASEQHKSAQDNSAISAAFYLPSSTRQDDRSFCILEIPGNSSECLFSEGCTLPNVLTTIQSRIIALWAIQMYSNQNKGY